MAKKKSAKTAPVPITAPSRGTVTVAGQGEMQTLEIVDFVRATFRDHRLVSLTTLEDDSIALLVENPASTGRAPSNAMRLSPESLVALISTCFVYYTCKGVDMGALLLSAIEAGKQDVHYALSDNLTAPATWNEKPAGAVSFD